MTSTDSFLKTINLIRFYCDQLDLNLNGKKVLTECASAGYAATSVMAAFAGATVVAYGKDSRYGSFEDNAAFIGALAKELGVSDRISCTNIYPSDTFLNSVDILTNSGFLRPITKDTIKCLPKTAVIPLMWETWEFRPGEIDINACQDHEVCVIGTNEGYPDISMYAYPGALALKLLFSLGLEVVGQHFCLVGGGLTGRLIADTFRTLGLSFDWFSHDGTDTGEGPYSYTTIRQILSLKRLDAVIYSDHVHPTPVLGNGSSIRLSELKDAFPYIKWAHITGAVSQDDLTHSGIEFLPQKIQPFGYMTYDASNLGIEPIIRLMAGGLKVGQLGSDARHKGYSVNDAIQYVVDTGLGQDFDGGFMSFSVK